MLFLNDRNEMKLYFLRFSCILSALFLISLSLSAQTGSIDGLILDKGGLSRVGNATIINKKSGQVWTSSELGLFRMPATVGDTLVVSKSGYSDLELVVKSLEDLVIRLQATINLEEVTVQGQSKKQELDELREQYRKKGSYYAGKPPLLSYIFQPLTALYELVGKTPGQARRFNAFYMTELEQTEIDRRFNPYTVTRITSLEGSDLKNFMMIYRPGFESLSSWDEYGLINYIKKSLLTFNNSGRPKGLLSLPSLPKARDLSEKVLKY